MPNKYVATVNVPFAMKIKYVDVWPNNTEQNDGKGYGASLSLRGDIDGADAKFYPKGFLDANLIGMANAGIIAGDAAAGSNLDPAEKYSIPVVNGDVTITLSQPAGERYAKTVFATAKSGNGKPPAQATPATPSRNIGGPLPGEYDDDGYMDAVAGDPTPTATAVRPVVATALAPNVSKQDDFVSKIQRAALRWKAARAEILQHDASFADDLQALNAAIATVMIAADKL